MKKEDIELLDKRISTRMHDDCTSGDAEIDHVDADDILLAALKELGMTQTVKEYLKLQENFWYA